jgi:hypothetical protein
MPDGSAATPSTMIIPVRPASNQTRSTQAAQRFDRADADPLGVRRVFTQVSHDLYGTKDVQDAITASYVWMADQIGHLFLGLVPTLILAWLVSVFLSPGVIRTILIVVLALAMFGYWVSKEFTDFHDTKQRAGDIFPFDSSDIWWNVKTALTYFGIGGIWAVTAFLHGWALLIVVPLTFWPGLMVAYWWLRRKLAFQQAGLPYLYRLANFKAVMAPVQDPKVEEIVCKLANLKSRDVAMWRVLLGIDKVEQHLPIPRHILITGTLGAGKTSLAVGIGTEFAFALGIGRYLSAAKLVQLAADAPNMPQTQMEYDDGRVLWPWRQCDLIIVDDVDAGVTTPEGVQTHLIRPEDLAAALTIQGPKSLYWLRERRSIWVIGNAAGAAAWKAAISGAVGLEEGEMLVVDLTPIPSQPGAA